MSPPAAKSRKPSVDPEIWIIDGHNVIFAIDPLRDLQTAGRRGDAREGLVTPLKLFANRRAERILVVFDGNNDVSNPNALHDTFLDVVYTRQEDGSADDRIIHEARKHAERGLRVTVVTNDMSTLVRSLPRGVAHMPVRAFVRKLDTQNAKPVREEFADIEEQFGTGEVFVEFGVRAPSPTRLPAVKFAQTTTREGSRASEPPRVSAEESASRARAREKKEHGRLRHARRVKRRT